MNWWETLIEILKKLLFRQPTKDDSERKEIQKEREVSKLTDEKPYIVDKPKPKPKLTIEIIGKGKVNIQTLGLNEDITSTKTYCVDENSLITLTAHTPIEFSQKLAWFFQEFQFDPPLKAKTIIFNHIQFVMPSYDVTVKVIYKKAYVNVIVKEAKAFIENGKTRIILKAHFDVDVQAKVDHLRNEFDKVAIDIQTCYLGQYNSKEEFLDLGKHSHDLELDYYDDRNWGEKVTMWARAYVYYAGNARVKDVHYFKIDVECVEGQTKCKKYDLYKCQNGKWILIEKNSPKCGYKPPRPPPPPIEYTIQRFIIKNAGRVELTWDGNETLIVATRDVKIEKGKKVIMKCHPSATITVRQVIWKAGEYVASEPIDVIEGEELTFVADADYRFDIKFKETKEEKKEEKKKEEKKYSYPSKRLSKEIKFRIRLTIDGKNAFKMSGRDNAGIMYGTLLHEKGEYEEGKAKLEGLYWASGSAPFTIELLDKGKLVFSKDAPFTTDLSFGKGNHKLTIVIRDKKDPKCGHVIHLKEFIVK